MQSLQEIFSQITQEYRAIGHFNISNLELLNGIVRGALAVRQPVMIGTSEGEANFIGYRQAVALVHSLRQEHGLPIFINADHHKSVEAAKRAIDAGYDSVHIDLSALPFEENLAGTKEVVSYAKASGREVHIEGEVGYFMTESSKRYSETIEIPLESLASPEQAERFVAETGVARLAPAVGSLHGIAANEPHIDFRRIAEIRRRVPLSVALVLHGASGLSDETVSRAIQEGISNVHVSTELRVLYSKALRDSLASSPDETTPYKLLLPVVESLASLVEKKMRLFEGKVAG